MKKTLVFLTAALLGANLSAQGPQLQLTPLITSGLQRISAMTQAGDHRLFILEQAGRIRIADTLGVLTSTPFLDITSLVNSTGNEQGLLGLAFHPDYSGNGYFFVNYTNSAGNTVVARYSVSSTDPNLADASSAQILLTINQPYTNHNGGSIVFGPDGYLYIGMGDGGSANDPQGNGQNNDVLLGKMLRIDVDNGSPYAIPSDNPFYGATSPRPEIWASGLRNPWKFSFDRQNGNLWIADVGQNQWEEVDFQLAGTGAGDNYGWRCWEGNHATNLSNCANVQNQHPPVVEYSHSGGNCSITGGYVYRGAKFPYVQGYYVYADYCSGKFWTIDATSGTFANNTAGTFNAYDFASFGEDANGEIYVAGNSSGKVYKMEQKCQVDGSVNTQNVSCFGYTDGSATINPTGGAAPYSYSWSNGASTQTLSSLAPGTYSVQVSDKFGCKKTLSVPISQPTALQTSLAYFAGNPSYGEVNATGGTMPYSYLWSNGSIADTAQAQVSGWLYVQVTDSKGCTKSDSVFVSAAGLAELGISNFSLAPNPSSGNITISIASESNFEVQLMDAQGRSIWRENFAHTEDFVQKDFSTLSAGIYTLQIVNAKGYISRKWMKE